MNNIDKAERFKESDFKMAEEDLISPVSVASHLNDHLFHVYNQFLKTCLKTYFDDSGYSQFVDLINLYKSSFKFLVTSANGALLRKSTKFTFQNMAFSKYIL